jgi:hypothetical protein
VTAPDPISDALRWRIRRLTAEASQHRSKAAIHTEIADDLDVKVIEYRQLLRTLHTTPEEIQ